MQFQWSHFYWLLFQKEFPIKMFCSKKPIRFVKSQFTETTAFLMELLGVLKCQIKIDFSPLGINERKSPLFIGFIWRAAGLNFHGF